MPILIVMIGVTFAGVTTSASIKRLCWADAAGLRLEPHSKPSDVKIQSGSLLFASVRFPKRRKIILPIYPYQEQYCVFFVGEGGGGGGC